MSTYTPIELFKAHREKFSSTSSGLDSFESLQQPAEGPGQGLLDIAIAGFAIWTLLVHGTVAMGGNLYVLLILATVVLVAVVALSLRRNWRLFPTSRSGLVQGTATGPPSVPVSQATEPQGHLGPASSQKGNSRQRQLGLQFLALGGCYLFLFFRDWMVFWWIGTGLLTLFLAFSPNLPLRDEAPLERRSWHRSLVALALALAVATLIVHRPDQDDALFVGQAVGIADHPSVPILAEDNLHGIPGLPLPLPVYKVETLGVWVGAVTFLTPLESLDIAHFVVPVLAALLVPFAYARLFRRILPRNWIWGVGATILFLWCAGDTHTSYGNFAFVRLFQGKGIFQTLGVPLILSAAMEFGRAPTRLRWYQLVATQIATVGLTSTALFVAPALAGLGLLASLPWRRNFLPNLALGVAASAYVLVLAAWMSSQMPNLGGGTPPSLSETERAADSPARAAAPMIQAADKVLGASALANLASLAILGAGVATRSPLGRRFGLILPLGFLLILWNPLVDDWLQAYVLGPRTYWRVFWALPVPVLVALLLTGPLKEPSRGRRAHLRRGFVTAVVVVLLLGTPETYTGAQENKVVWSWPSWKVPEADFAAALAVVEATSPSSIVLAPPKVAAWVVTLPDRPQTLVVRRAYLRSLREGLGFAETGRRMMLMRWTERRLRALDAEVTASIDHYEIQVICVRQQVNRDPSFKTLLEAKGFRPTHQSREYAVWARSLATAPPGKAVADWVGSRIVGSGSIGPIGPNRSAAE